MRATFAALVAAIVLGLAVSAALAEENEQGNLPIPTGPSTLFVAQPYSTVAGPEQLDQMRWMIHEHDDACMQ